MFEMPHTGHHQRNATFFSSSNNFFVTDRASGLNDGDRSGIGCFDESVGERKEGIAGDQRIFQVMPKSLCIGYCDPA